MNSPSKPVIGALAWVLRFALPNEDQFFDLLIQGAQALGSSADNALYTCRATTADARAMQLRAVAEHDKKSEDVTHDVKIALAKTFITPLPREVILKTAQYMARVVNDISETMNLLTILSFEPLSANTVQLVELVSKASKLVVEAAGTIRPINIKRLTEIAQQLSELERQGDTLYLKGLKELQSNTDQNATNAILRFKFLNGLEQALDDLKALGEQYELLAVQRA